MKGAARFQCGRAAFSFVVCGMPIFQILYFRESVLEHAEEVDARDVLRAVEKTAGQPAHLKVEVWSEHRKVATIGASPIHVVPRRPKRLTPA